jgi:hypothetical protein
MDPGHCPVPNGRSEIRLSLIPPCKQFVHFWQGRFLSYAARVSKVCVTWNFLSALHRHLPWAIFRSHDSIDRGRGLVTRTGLRPDPHYFNVNPYPAFCFKGSG